jgi:class 3 adenylate cyclase
MHRRLRELLETSEGSAAMVLAVFLDIRGFTRFASQKESTETAEFLRHMFLRIVEGYFPDHAFFKPTGDGLMIVQNLTRATVRDTINATVGNALDLVEGFPRICDDDPMINFETPDDLGIGIARGVATALVSDGMVLDYSGRPLNVAARMLGIARPKGVVFHQSLDIRLVKDALMERFAEDEVFVRGVTDDRPTTIYLTPEWTVIDDHFRTPTV